MNDFDREIFIMAWKYWNQGIIPPQEYQADVAEFINEYRELFRGADPQ